MTLRDAHGNAVGTASHEALAAAEQALWRMMSFYGTPVGDLDCAIAADPGWLLPRVMKAGFLLGLTEPDLVADGRAALGEAEARSGSGNARERGHLAAVQRVALGDWQGASDAWQEVLDAHPRDALALQWVLLFDFYRGDTQALLERVARASPEWHEDDPLFAYVLGLHAFGLEETGHYAEAEAAGRRALAGAAKVPWAIHAVAHVMEMQGRHDEGRRWMAQWRPDWGEGNGFAGHLGWHEAVFCLESLDAEAALVPF
ncbi:MAG TPA: tetratricopeptide repeat protein, partial [Caldimonas sp.]|nr:tetratricopeptide repeat protein [Caldimonas sp.]